MNNKSYIFLGDLIRTDLESPLNLFDDFYLVRADNDQRVKIKNSIDSYYQTSPFKTNKFEINFVPNGELSYELHPIEEKDWNYYVVEHSKRQAEGEFQLVASLSTLDLTIVFEAVYTEAPLVGGGIGKGHGTSIQLLRASNYFHDDGFATRREAKEITRNIIEEFNELSSLIASFDRTYYSTISKALNDFLRIKEISSRSRFKILNYFSVLELLLVTSGYKSSNNNSITNQLKKKINLVNNQLSEKIEVVDYFKGPETLNMEMVIETLYEYRSNIAHGSTSDFENKLKVLKEKEKILPFLHEILRRFLIYSMQEPQLISDLKAC